MEQTIRGSALLINTLLLQVGLWAQTPPPIQWQTCLGGTAGEDGNGLYVQPDGKIYVLGKSHSTDGDLTLNPGAPNAWVVRLAADGTMEAQWTVLNSGFNGADAAFDAAMGTPVGGCTISGFADSNAGGITYYGGGDVMVAKFTASGERLWLRTFGGSSYDVANDIVLVDNGYLVGATSYSNDGMVTGAFGEHDFWVVKVDHYGNALWQQSYGGSAADDAFSLTATADGGFAMAGTTYSTDGQVTGSHGAQDAWLIKADAQGTLQWQHAYGSSGHDVFFEVHHTTDGGFVMAGHTDTEDGDVQGLLGDGDVWVVKVDALGAIQWQKCLGGLADDMGHSIRQTPDGGYAVLCSAVTNGMHISGFHGEMDYWLVRLSATGDILWQRCLGGSDGEIPKALEITSDGCYLMVGESRSHDGDVENEPGQSDIWVVKLAADELSTGVPTTPVPTGGLLLAPHPASSHTWLTIEAMGPTATVSVLDAKGRQVLNKLQTVPTDRLELTSLVPGLYTVRVVTAGTTSYTRMVVQ
jgi:hypothetical protein